jgi:pimeloyl-ACP methyl ester carboxylesterase
MSVQLATMKQLLASMQTCADDKKVLTQALGLSSLVYFSNDFIAAQLTAIGMTYKIFEQADMKCVVAETSDTIFISFRGTVPSQWANWKRIVNIIPRSFMYNLKVHGGFELYYQEYAAFVKSYIDTITTHKCVIFTGHSLGAAIASLFNISYTKNSTSITFASPEYLFNHPFESTSSTSYRIMQDFVTYIPFNLPLLKWYKSSTTIKVKSFYRSVNPLSYHSLNNYIKSILIT